MDQRVSLNYKSCFDIIGPVMVGPSSSHTAGAIAIGRLARLLLGGNPQEVVCTYYESFAQTHLGHGTDFAIVSGLLGFPPDDRRVPHALEIADQAGIRVTFIEGEGDSPVGHANTADLVLQSQGQSVRLTGISVGGGSVEVKYIELKGYDLQLTGPLPILLEEKQLLEPSPVLALLQEEQMRILNQRVSIQGDRELIAYELADLVGPSLDEELRRLALSRPVYLLY